MRAATFDRFEFLMPLEAVRDCSGPGPADDAVAYWAPRIARPEACTADAMRAELREYGAWDEAELADDNENWRRCVWISAGNIAEGGAA